MRRRGFVPLAGVLLLSPVLVIPPAAAAPARCGAPSTRTQRLEPLTHGMGEASGLVASWEHSGVGWMIRDSGHPASIYSLRLRNGWPVVREVRVLEPDPDHATTVRLLSRRRYQYPGTGFQNTEASFWFEGHLVLATKSSPTRLYRFASLDGPGTLRPDYVGALYGAPRISMLRPAPDHSALIGSDHERVAVFEGKGPGSRLGDFVGKGPAYAKTTFRGDNVEAGDFFPTGSC